MEIAITDRTFAALDLSAQTLASLDAMGYKVPTDVQLETIPRAFGIPIVERVDPAKEAVQAVVLAPTRELALQVARELAEIGRSKGVKIESVYGGDSMERQLEGIRAGAHVIAGTPGRVLDHLRRKTLRFDQVKTFVLDEADRMLDMGFAVEMGQIMEYVPAERQTLLFSATIPLGIRGLIYHYLSDPEWVLLSEDQIYVKEVEHLYCLTPKLHKEATLYKLLEYENPASSMIFCNTTEGTRLVYTFLLGKGLPAAMLSSNLPQQYTRRAGRTGRVGKSGRAISLVSAMDLMNFNRLVKRYHVEVKDLAVPSDEEVQARTVERIVTRLAAEGQTLPLDDYAEFSPIARRVAEHEHRDRILALLLRKFFQAPPPEPEEEDAAPPPPRRDGGGGFRRRHRRR